MAKRKASKHRPSKAELAAAAKRSAAARKGAETKRQKAAAAEALKRKRSEAARKGAETKRQKAFKRKRSEAARKGAETKRQKKAAAEEKAAKRREAARKGAETKRQKRVAAAKAEGKPKPPKLKTYHAGIDYQRGNSRHGKTNLHVELAVKVDADLVQPEDLNRVLQHYAQTGDFPKGVYDVRLLSWQHQHHAKQTPDDEFEEEEARRDMLTRIAPAGEFYPLGGSKGDSE
jgi:hypothetical protein